MTTLVHLSDTHFGTEVPVVMRAVEQAILTIKPDIVTISGDITQRARPSEFNAAARFLDSLSAKIRFAIPGNHDIPLFNLPLRLLAPYAHYHRFFGLREGIWCHNNIGIIGYNATSRWRHTRGLLPDATLAAHVARARAQLKPGAFLIACAHQPLVTAWPEDHENVLVNAQHTAELFAEHHADLVMSGHVHVPLISTTEAAFPDLKRHFILSGAGTAISHRIRPGAPNSFNVIRIASAGQPPAISITLMEYQPDDSTFIAAREQRFAMGAKGWVDRT